MLVLIVFATVEGQSAKIAEFAAQKTERQGNEVTSLNTDDAVLYSSFDDVEKLILVAPVHERRHPKSFEIFLSDHRDRIAKIPTMMLSVSLSAAFPDGLEDAEDYLVEMKMRTGLAPDAEMLVPGAVRRKSYDYFASQVLHHIVLRDRNFDPGQRDHEFTDWVVLEDRLTSFLTS